MTTTSLLAAQSVGGSAGVVGATKTTAQSTTTAYVLSALVTNGNGLPSLRAPVVLWYSSSPFSMTAAQASTRLKSTARWVDLPIPNAGAGILVKDSTFEALTGQYIYAWLETELFDNPITVDLSLQEV